MRERGSRRWTPAHSGGWPTSWPRRTSTGGRRRWPGWATASSRSNWSGPPRRSTRPPVRRLSSAPTPAETSRSGSPGCDAGTDSASQCPSCARLYAADMFQLIRAGVTGGKTVPASVAENPLVFATLTAPSFGPVHGRRDHDRPCHPKTGKLRLCRHRRPTSCQVRHSEDDPALGQPLCPDCYDYASQVIWQWWAPDLWRRFTITLRRLVAKRLGVPVTRLVEVAMVQYAKVAEYQLRGVVHFHALVRLDGSRTPDGFAPAPHCPDTGTLADLLGQAARLAAAHRPRRLPRRPDPGARLRPAGRRPPRPGHPPHRQPRPRPELRPGRGLPRQVRHQVRHRHHQPDRRRQPPPPADLGHHPTPRTTSESRKRGNRESGS